MFLALVTVHLPEQALTQGNVCNNSCEPDILSGGELNKQVGLTEKTDF